MLIRDGAARLLIFASLAVAAPAQSPPLEVRARTILAANCEACHGQARMSDFDVRALESILQGGKRGPAVVPGMPRPAVPRHSTDWRVEDAARKAPRTSDGDDPPVDRRGREVAKATSGTPHGILVGVPQPRRPGIPAVKNH
jgi:hypothetical protein